MLSSVLFALTLSSSTAQADGLKTLAVQNRQHTQTHEFSGWVGGLPLDAFTKGLTVSGAYSLHFSDVIGWEVAQFTWSHGIDTRLNDELAALSVGPTPFERLEMSLLSNVIFKPLYGKQSVLNRGLIYHETFLTAGGGYGWMTLGGRPAVSLGAGTRIYAGEHLSFRLDVRDQVYFGSTDNQNELWIALGTSLSFR